MWKSLIVLTFISFFPTNIYAADGSSGCGPAWYVFKDNSLVSSFARAVTNGFLTPVVTLGMTFGTSNCGKHKIVDNNKRSEHLATIAFENLRQDAARGQGQFVDAYAQTFACQSNTIPLFRQELQKNYDLIFSGEASPTEITERTKQVIGKSSILAGSCSPA